MSPCWNSTVTFGFHPVWPQEHCITAHRSLLGSPTKIMVEACRNMCTCVTATMVMGRSMPASCAARTAASGLASATGIHLPMALAPVRMTSPV